MKGPPVSEKAKKLHQKFLLENKSLALEEAKKFRDWSQKILDERGVRRQHLWNRFCPSLRECFCSS